MQEAERRIRIKAVLVMEMPENCLEYPCDDVCGESCQVMDGIVEGKENMERLTKYSNDLIRNKAVNILRKLDSENGLDGDELALISSFCLIERVENKQLKKYEDLEEQGKLLKLPCKLGDITFWTSDEDDEENKIPTVRENTPIVGIAVQEDGFYILFDGDNEYQKVGERWAFLTREDAEAALKELERGKGE